MKNLQADLQAVIKNHKSDILNMGYIGKQKGMQSVLRIAFDDTEGNEKFLDIVFTFEGNGWPKSGKSSSDRIKL